MRNIFKLLTASLVVLSSSAYAATVNVEWRDMDSFTDIVEGNTQSRKNFRQRIQDELTQAFQEQIAKSSDSLIINITVIDVDLAGEVSQGLAVKIRQVRDQDFPRLKFILEIKDSDGQTLHASVQNIKEKAAKHSAFRMKGSQSDFYLEKQLIEKWSEEMLLPSLVELGKLKSS